VSSPVYEFGGFRLDCGRFEIQLNGKALRLERKPMELLTLLA
jgi:DNA-binding response OmpR family regulator